MTTIDDAWDDRKMTPEQKEMVHQLSEAEIKEIDRNLLENASDEWCKVDRLVLTTMIEREEGVTGLPESFLMLSQIRSVMPECLYRASRFQ